ncbi:hypothetical protein KIL84_006863 [Mauremys mutica]|uniref:Uncharacterized protein n=1 Tax=Mauremys mutica TaxID=74926 RepID=A0A9D3X2A0_9SAUR|nr:hypothetical protein KIL84_006863 [Mauremys mutica]
MWPLPASVSLWPLRCPEGACCSCLALQCVPWGCWAVTELGVNPPPLPARQRVQSDKEGVGGWRDFPGPVAVGGRDAPLAEGLRPCRSNILCAIQPGPGSGLLSQPRQPPAPPEGQWGVRSQEIGVY